MRLNTIDLYMDWPTSVEVYDLRKFIISNLTKKGEIVRWSIVDIQDSEESSKAKQIRIKAVLINSSSEMLFK